MNPAHDEGEVIICYGGAKPTDTHLASTVHCVDDEIIEWLERRERRRRRAAANRKGTFNADLLSINLLLLGEGETLD